MVIMELLWGCLLGVISSIIPGSPLSYLYNMDHEGVGGALLIIGASSVNGVLDPVLDILNPIQREADPYVSDIITKYVRKGRGVELVKGAALTFVVGRGIGMAAAIALVICGTIVNVKPDILYISAAMGGLMWWGLIRQARSGIVALVIILACGIVGYITVEMNIDFMSLGIGLFAIPYSLGTILGGGYMPPQKERYGDMLASGYKPLLSGALSAVMVGIPTSCLLNVLYDGEDKVGSKYLAKGAGSSISMVMALWGLGERSAADSALAKIENIGLAGIIGLLLLSLVVGVITLCLVGMITKIYLIISKVPRPMIGLLSLITSMFTLVNSNGAYETIAVIAMGLGVAFLIKVSGESKTLSLASFSLIPFLSLI